MFPTGFVVVRRERIQRTCRLEAEAMWAMYVEHKSLDALEVCAGPGKMWEHYSPTPLTREWLEEEGFIK